MTLSKTLNELKALVLCGIVILFTQWVNCMRGGTNYEFLTAVVGMFIIIIISILSLKIKQLLPWKIPAFAWASILGLLVTTPWCPIQQMVLDFTNAVTTGSVSSVILAVAGISIGTKLSDIKRLSWKMIIVAVFVFCGTFFGSALIAQLILSVQGMI